MCPRLDESAGKRRSTRIRHATPRLKTALVQAAWVATRKNGSCLQAQFRRLKGRRGPKKAIVAVAASMLTAAYFMLRDETDYHDRGGRYLANRDKQRVIQPRQLPQRPVGVPLRGRPQTQGDDPSLLFAVEQFGDRGRVPPFSFQRLLEPFEHAALTNVLDGLGAARKGVGDLLVGPGWPVRVGLQENLGAAHLLAAAAELADCLPTDLAFLSGESNDVLLLRHENSLGSIRVPRQS